MQAGADQQFDLEAYSANYTSHAKVNRLIFIANKTNSVPIQLEALRIAADELQHSYDTSRYSEVCRQIGGRLGPQYVIDSAKLAKKQLEAEQKHQALDNELNGYKTNLIKNSIRMCQTYMGDHAYNRGNLQDAFKCYVRTRDYCSTAKDITQMCLNVIKVAIELNNYTHVQNYVSKAESTPDVQDSIISTKLKCAAGLAALKEKKYKAAARKFTDVSAELGSSYSDVMSVQDVALYGSLCSLASCDRQELKRTIIENFRYREVLSTTPEVRDLVYDFYSSKYAACLSTLDRLKPFFNLDIHLSTHVNTLCSMVRNRALIQYSTPFTSVNLATMAPVFITDVSALEKELAKLIQDKQIQARIDSHAKVLHARHANLRSQTFQAALQAGDEYLQETHSLLLRSSLMRHDIFQRAQMPRGRGMQYPEHTMQMTGPG
ncbi:hypothetical protein WJX84_008155 [Apatococcus fuscideae]|uniref:PCI domain-containing protein n=1 Tax=Apatococcus fuscideae TaxID=2026836 RepID=A0AAW1SUU4_9CHLO